MNNNYLAKFFDYVKIEEEKGLFIFKCRVRNGRNYRKLKPENFTGIQYKDQFFSLYKANITLDEVEKLIEMRKYKFAYNGYKSKIQLEVLEFYRDTLIKEISRKSSDEKLLNKKVSKTDKIINYLKDKNNAIKELTIGETGIGKSMLDGINYPNISKHSSDYYTNIFIEKIFVGGRESTREETNLVYLKRDSLLIENKIVPEKYLEGKHLYLSVKLLDKDTLKQIITRNINGQIEYLKDKLKEMVLNKYRREINYNLFRDTEKMYYFDEMLSEYDKDEFIAKFKCILNNKIYNEASEYKILDCKDNCIEKLLETEEYRYLLNDILWNSGVEKAIVEQINDYTEDVIKKLTQNVKAILDINNDSDEYEKVKELIENDIVEFSIEDTEKTKESVKKMKKYKNIKPGTQGIKSINSLLIQSIIFMPYRQVFEKYFIDKDYVRVDTQGIGHGRKNENYDRYDSRISKLIRKYNIDYINFLLRKDKNSNGIISLLKTIKDSTDIGVVATITGFDMLLEESAKEFIDEYEYELGEEDDYIKKEFLQDNNNFEKVFNEALNQARNKYFVYNDLNLYEVLPKENIFYRDNKQRIKYPSDLDQNIVQGEVGLKNRYRIISSYLNKIAKNKIAKERIKKLNSIMISREIELSIENAINKFIDTEISFYNKANNDFTWNNLECALYNIYYWREEYYSYRGYDVDMVGDLKLSIKKEMNEVYKGQENELERKQVIEVVENLTDTFNSYLLVLNLKLYEDLLKYESYWNGNLYEAKTTRRKQHIIKWFTENRKEIVFDIKNIVVKNINL